jgi:hypothetical protein
MYYKNIYPRETRPGAPGGGIPASRHPRKFIHLQLGV